VGEGEGAFGAGWRGGGHFGLGFWWVGFGDVVILELLSCCFVLYACKDASEFFGV
jgi:hypothetical protein